MEMMTVVVRDHEGMAHAMPLLLAINRQSEDLDVEFILVTDTQDRANLGLKGNKKIKKILLPEGTLESPLSLNMALEAANGEIVAFIDGGVRPLTKLWPQSILECFEEPLVAGACSYVIPDSSSSISARVQRQVSYIGGMLMGRKRFDQLPVPGFTPENMAIKLAYWRMQKFDETISLASSVDCWAEGCFAKGLDIMGNWAFAVGYDDGEELLEDLSMTVQAPRKVAAMKGIAPRPRRSP